MISKLMDSLPTPMTNECLNTFGLIDAYMSLNWVIIGSGRGFLFAQQQTIS